jgi:AraC-like DNA-binding protein
VAPAGEINLAIPGETHTGQAAGIAGWAYRMFYIDPCLMENDTHQIAGKPSGLLFFKTAVIKDPHLAHMIYQLHRDLEDDRQGCLAQDSRLLAMFSLLIRKHAAAPPARVPRGNEIRPVKRACAYPKSHLAEDIRLADRARVAALSPYHFIRVFKAHTGLTPHAYLIQTRLRVARQLLEHNHMPAAVAQGIGFADQSHFNRHFKRVCGMTPGQYRNFVQDE